MIKYYMLLAVIQDYSIKSKVKFVNLGEFEEKEEAKDYLKRNLKELEKKIHYSSYIIVEAYQTEN